MTKLHYVEYESSFLFIHSFIQKEDERERERERLLKKVKKTLGKNHKNKRDKAKELSNIEQEGESQR